jgi:plasmid maintenance system antidote protein VapI
VILPREYLERALRQRQITPVDFARREALPFAIVHQLLAGDYPTDATALHAVGRAIGLSAVDWAEALAPGLARQSPLEARTSFAGRLWRLLVTTPLTMAALAAELGVGVRSLQVALGRGLPGPRLRRGPLLDRLGVPPGDALRRGLPQAGDAELAQAVGEALAREDLSRAALARAAGTTARTIAQLAEGVVPAGLDPRLAPRLAPLLRLSREHLAGLLARSWRALPIGAGTLTHLLIRHCFLHGLTTAHLARRLGLPPRVVRGIIAGRCGDERALDALYRELRCSDGEWEQALYAQSLHRQASGARARGDRPLAPLRQLVFDAATRAGVTPYAWGERHGLRRDALRGLLDGGLVPRREEVRSQLMRALRLDRVAYDTASRALAATFSPRRHQLDGIVPVTGVQEALLQLVRRQRLPLALIAQRTGVPRREIERLLREGACELRPDGREGLRRLLGLDRESFARQCAPSEVERVADEEQRLMRVFRKLAQGRKKLLLEQAGRILAAQSAGLMART